MKPFALRQPLSPDLTRVLAYWEGLKRGQASIPFSDDLVPGDLADLQPNIFTLKVTDRPERFQGDTVGEALKPSDGAELSGRFLDEVRLEAPFDYLAAQASATTESGAPTLHRGGDGRPYARLLLPMWNMGRIDLILGAIDND